jgi:poly-gamma-glutamate synthesis protein (capsule biosynthesis protein)
MKIGFVGDLMFGDQPITFGYGFDHTHRASTFQHVFSSIAPTLKEFDIVIGNFESVIRKLPENISVKNWSMCTDEYSAKSLKDSNFTIVSMANNHTMDYGEDGYYYTKSVLEKNNLIVIGDKNKPYCIVEKEGNAIACIAASYLPESNGPALYWHKPEKSDWQFILEEISAISPNCKVFAYVHWGNEFVGMPNEEQVNIAKMLDSLGIDVIIGHHPHIIQPNYYIGKTPTIFSLGNFISDYWQERLRKTVILEAVVTSSKINLSQYQCKINEHGCPEFILKSPANIKKFENEISSISDINRARFIMRKEYLIQIIKNIHRVKGKFKMCVWLLDRLVYILRYGRQELKKPEILYEKYKNK